MSGAIPKTGTASSRSPSRAAPLPRRPARPLKARRPMILVGDAAEPRSAAFQAALARRALPAARIVGYPEIARDPDLRLEAALIRFDSPGRSRAAREALFRMGAEPLEAEGGAPFGGRELESALEDTGRILPLRQMILGLREAMCRVETTSATFMNAPEDVALAFDKPACQTALRGAGVPVPRGLGPVEHGDALRERMRALREPRAFVKLDHGSAGSGLVAFAVGRDREQALSTTEVVHSGKTVRLYDSRRLQRYRDRDDVSRLLDGLARLGAYAERWIPKASLGGRASDLRVVIVAGEPTHLVVRASATPFTNLHLGGTRHSIDSLRARMTSQAFEHLLETCRRVSRVFPKSLYLGLDVLVGRDYRRHWVLEANAFGDFIKGAIAGGKTPHDAELDALFGHPAAKGQAC